MRRVLTALSIATLATFTLACDGAEEEVETDDFRALGISIQMTMADGGDEDGTIVWELGEGAVYEGPAEENNVLLTIEGNSVVDSEGNTTCSVTAPYLNSNVREVVVANGGPVLLTVWRNYVFEGHVDISTIKLSQLKNAALFEYEDNEIYLGRVETGFRVMETDADLEGLSRGYKLLMAALMTGQCGSAGLPGYSF